MRRPAGDERRQRLSGDALATSTDDYSQWNCATRSACGTVPILRGIFAAVPTVIAVLSLRTAGVTASQDVAPRRSRWADSTLIFEKCRGRGHVYCSPGGIQESGCFPSHLRSALLALACVTAAAGGAYVAVRQNGPRGDQRGRRRRPAGARASSAAQDTEAVVTPPVRPARTPAPALEAARRAGRQRRPPGNRTRRRRLPRRPGRPPRSHEADAAQPGPRRQPPARTSGSARQQPGRRQPSERCPGDRTRARSGPEPPALAEPARCRSAASRPAGASGARVRRARGPVVVGHRSAVSRPRCRANGARRGPRRSARHARPVRSTGAPPFPRARARSAR